MFSNMKRGKRNQENPPTVVAEVPQTVLDIQVFRGISADGNAVFHLKLPRRNRAGNGYYSTYRVEDIFDLVLGCQYAASKFALVEELDPSLRAALGDLAQRLLRLIAETASRSPINGHDKSNEQPNGLASAFGPA